MASSTSRSKAALAAVGAGLALTAALPASASAAEPTRLTIKHSPPRFVGHVVSNVRACEQHRRVILFRKQRGPNDRIDSDRSEDSGRWAIDIEREDFRPGTYYARVTWASRGAVTCAGDRTRDVRANSN